MGIVYQPSPTQAPGPLMCPGAGPLTKDVVDLYNVEAGPVSLVDVHRICIGAIGLVDLYNVLISYVQLADEYAIKINRPVVDAYDIHVGLSLVDLYNIDRAVFKTLVDLHNIEIGAVSLVDESDIHVAGAMVDLYDILLSKNVTDLYNIRVAAVPVVDVYDIRMAKALVDLYDIRIQLLAGLADLYNIKVASIPLVDLFDIEVGKYLVDSYNIISAAFNYYYLDTFAFSSYLRQSPLSTFSGYTPERTEWEKAGSRDLEFFDRGRKPLKWTGKLIFLTEDAEAHFREACIALDGGYTAFLGSSQKMYHVASTLIRPAWPIKRFDIANEYDISLEFEEPWAWAGEGEGYAWTPGQVTVPAESDTFENEGDADAPLYSAIITGKYASGYPTDIYLQILDAADVLQASLKIADQLLSDEVATVDRNQREITLTYSDDFSSSTRWTRDTTRSGSPSLAGGVVTVPASSSFFYHFDGAHPQIASQGIKLTATITVGAGSPVIEYSTNGTSWSTAVSAEEIAAASGKKAVFYLNGTALETDIYVRFRSPSGASMTIAGIEFESKRDIQGEALLEIPVGETRKAKIVGRTGSQVSPVVTFRSRYYPK